MAGTEKVILAKKEAVYGTDAAPTPAENAVLTRNFTREPILTDTLDRNLDLPSRGRSKSANTNRRTTFGYELELAGSGAAGTAPGWMEHLEACGMAPPVLTAGEEAELRFAGVNDPMSAITVHHWTGGERVRARGARGTYSLDFTAGAYPFARLEMQGLLPPRPAAPVDAVPPSGAPDFSRWIEPVEVHTENTVVTIGGHPLVLRSLTVDIGADVRPRNLVGANYISRGDHAATGRILAEATDLAARNFYADLDAGAEEELLLEHGIVAGNIIGLIGPRAQIIKVTSSEEDDRLMLDIQFGLNVGSGSDDLILYAK